MPPARSKEVRSLLERVKSLSNMDYQSFMCQAWDSSRPSEVQRSITKYYEKRGERNTKVEALKSGILVEYPAPAPSTKKSAWKSTVLSWAAKADRSDRFGLLKEYITLFNQDEMKSVQNLIGQLRKRRVPDERHFFSSSSKRRKPHEYGLSRVPNQKSTTTTTSVNGDGQTENNNIIKYEVLDEVGESDSDSELQREVN